MADKTDTNNRLIFGVTALTLATMLALKFVLSSYFNQMVDEEQGRKSLRRPASEIARLRESEGQRLTGGRLPIDRAMENLAREGRMGSALVAPVPSTDMAPMTGWIAAPSEHRSETPVALPTPTPPPSAPQTNPPPSAPPTTPPGTAPAATGHANQGPGNPHP